MKQSIGLVVCLVAHVFATIATAQTKEYFVGSPNNKVLGSANGGTYQKLSKNEAFEFALIISKVGDEYFWSSRDNKKLLRHQSGIFEVFVAWDGSGIIKIQLLDEITIEPNLQPEYFEMIHSFLGTLT